MASPEKLLAIVEHVMAMGAHERQSSKEWTITWAFSARIFIGSAVGGTSLRARVTVDVVWGEAGRAGLVHTGRGRSQMVRTCAIEERWVSRRRSVCSTGRPDV